jgi:hypothetical protein
MLERRRAPLSGVREEQKIRLEFELVTLPNEFARISKFLAQLTAKSARQGLETHVRDKKTAPNRGSGRTILENRFTRSL